MITIITMLKNDNDHDIMIIKNDNDHDNYDT